MIRTPINNNTSSSFTHVTITRFQHVVKGPSSLRSSHLSLSYTNNKTKNRQGLSLRVESLKTPGSPTDPSKNTGRRPSNDSRGLWEKSFQGSFLKNLKQ